MNGSQREHLSVETLQSVLDALVRERQTLRVTGAEQLELERNRREIVERQYDLSRALIDRHSPLPAA